jgi:hypothetical protein
VIAVVSWTAAAPRINAQEVGAIMRMPIE